MAAKKQRASDEPSMEEILSSIRQIISEDTTSQSGAAAAPAKQDDDVLELTDEVEGPDSGDPFADEGDTDDDEFFLGPAEDEDRAASRSAPSFGGHDADDDDDDLASQLARHDADDDDDDDFARAARPEPAAPPARRRPADDDGTWVSPHREQAATASLERLAEARRQAEDGEASRSETDRILEKMVREALQPQVKAWLDNNLPGLVERIVREEVQRMARNAESGGKRRGDAY
jgi:hypothetical protein